MFSFVRVAWVMVFLHCNSTLTKTEPSQNIYFSTGQLIRTTRIKTDDITEGKYFYLQQNPQTLLHFSNSPAEKIGYHQATGNCTSSPGQEVHIHSLQSYGGCSNLMRTCCSLSGEVLRVTQSGRSYVRPRHWHPSG